MQAETKSPPKHERPPAGGCVTRSWIGYGLISFCSSLLLFGVCHLLMSFGLEAAEYARVVAMFPLVLSFLLFAIGILYRLAIITSGSKVEIESRKQYSRIAGLLFLGGVVSVVVGDCRLNMKQEGSPRPAQTTIAAAQWTRHSLQDVPISFEILSSYLPPHEQSPGYVALFDRPRGIRAAVFAAPRTDFAFASLQEYAEATRKLWLAELPDSSFTSMEVIRGGKHPVIRQMLENVEHGVLIHTLMEHHEIGDHWIELRFVATPSRLSPIKGEIQRVSASLALVP